MKKLLIESALVSMLLVTTSQVALAAPIATSTHLDANAASHADLVGQADASGKVNAWLQREDVQAQLVAHGVSVQEAQSRIAALSDRDMARVGATIDSMPAGSSALAIAGIVLVVMLILEVLGVTDLFKSM